MEEAAQYEPVKATSRVTSKGQVTLPQEVRLALQIKRGDTLSFCVENDKAVITKLETFDVGWHRALEDTLEEWTSPEDEESFRDL